MKEIMNQLELDQQEKQRLADIFPNLQGFDTFTPYEAQAHVGTLTGLDRMIYEDCYINGKDVQAPHPSAELEPWHYRPETIVKFLGCEFFEANILSKSFKTLDLDRKSSINVLNQIKRGTITMTTINTTSEEMRAVEAAPITEAMVQGALGRLYEDTNLSRTPATTELLEDDKVIRKSMTEYHTLGQRPVVEWYLRQPRKFRVIYRAVQSCPRLTGLGKLGKHIHNKLGLLSIQSRVLWDLYKARQGSLFVKESKRQPSLKMVADKIQRAEYNQLKKIGQYLYSLNQQAPKTYSRGAWSYIWKLYRGKKKSCESKIMFDLM